MSFTEIILLDNPCNSCSGTTYLKESLVKVNQNLIKIGVIKGIVYDKFSCNRCGRLFFETKEIDYTKRPKNKI